MAQLKIGVQIRSGFFEVELLTVDEFGESF